MKTMLPLFVLLILAKPVLADEKTPALERATIRVGVQEGDFQGSDHRVIQAAIDYVAGLGGGTVEIGPGRYVLRDAVTLRDQVRLTGTPGKTVLAPVEGVKVALGSDGDANQRQITLADPSQLRVGDRVLIADDRNAGGFRVTSARLTARAGTDTFLIDTPLRDDYMVNRKGRVEHSFPAVGGWNIHKAVVEHLIIEGTRGRTACASQDGCRHGGIYLFECSEVVIRHCEVRQFNGDGISFQVSQHVTVEDCRCTNNAGHGLHPGSGSGHPILRRNHSLNNAADGMFVCWRVQHGIFEANQLEDNQGDGISIGHKDSDNLFRGNRILHNGRHGILFREEIEAMGAHRNVFEKNEILDNGTKSPAEKPWPVIAVRGFHHDLAFRDNQIGRTVKASQAPIGFLIDPQSRRLSQTDNRFTNVASEVQQGK